MARETAGTGRILLGEKTDLVFGLICIRTTNNLI